MSIDLLTQVAPSSPENERAVLGSMMSDHQAAMKAVSLLKADDFYDRIYKTVFASITRIINAGREADMMSVESDLSDIGHLEAVGGAGGIADLARAHGSPADIESYCAVVRNKAKARRFITRMKQLTQEAYDPSQNIDELLRQTETEVYDLLIGNQTGRIYGMDQIMDDALRHIMKAQEYDGGVVGLPSGLPYDKTLAGFQAAKMYVIAGRPGMGKTAFMLQNILAIARNGHPCGVISLEMGYVSLGTRMMLSHAGVDTHRAQTGQLNQGEIGEIKKSAEALKDVGVFIDDTTQVDPATLRIKARMMKQVHKIKLLAVDYVQLMTSDNPSREQQVSEISRTCKELSKELDIPVLALAQLSRKPDERRGFSTRPELGDLRESGSLEQDADVVMFLYQPAKYGIERYDNGTKCEGITEVVIKKHRDGPTAVWKLVFEPQYMKYLPISTDEPPLPPIEAYDDEPKF